MQPTISKSDRLQDKKRGKFMQRYQWKGLNKQQLGRFYEQHVQMELAMLGFELYHPAVDDHGVDLVFRWPKSPFLELQIKAIRKPEYLFVRKKHFEPSPGLYLAVGLHIDGQVPASMLIPSLVWRGRVDDALLDSVFCSNNYEGLKSDPEYGLRLTPKRFDALRERFDLRTMLEGIIRPALNARFLKTVFCDAFVFSSTPHSYLEQHESLSPEQKNLALAVHASDLYPSEMEKISVMVNALGAVFHWQDNSEGPLILTGKILYLLGRYGQDVPWFIHMWTLSDSVTR